MAAAGFSPEDYETDDIELWPENWQPWQTFCELSGQWRIAPSGGAAALDYTPLFMRLERMRLTDEAWEALFFDIRVIEAAALEQMRANQ
jgi:hypothetical protein